MRNLFSFFSIMSLFLLFACKREVSGCKDVNSLNFNPEATIDDNSCKYPEVRGCKDVNSLNFNPKATIEDNSCKYPSDLFAGRWKGSLHSHAVITYLPGFQVIDINDFDSLIFQLNRINDTTLQQQDTTLTFSANKDSLFKMINTVDTINNIRVIKKYHFWAILNNNIKYNFLQTKEISYEERIDLNGNTLIYQIDRVKNGTFTK